MYKISFILENRDIKTIGKLAKPKVATRTPVEALKKVIHDRVLKN